MKKLIAIILSAVLLFTSIISVSMFTVSAEGEALTDDVVMPVYLDEFGNEVNVLHTNERIPTSVASTANVNTPVNVDVTKNVSNLPFSTLFKVGLANTNNVNTSLTVEGAQGKGMIVYVEMPESADGNDVRLITQFSVLDGQSGEYSSRFQYGYQDWYCLAEGDTAWTAKTISYYGIPLASGFKGYIYIPFKTITGGASDLPETPDINEARPQKVNSNGEPLYKDNITGSETISATDETGAANAPVIQYSPSGAQYANTGIDEEDSVVGLLLQTSKTGTEGLSYMAANGNMAATDEIVISAPIIVKGEVSDTTTPDAAKIVAGGEEHYFFATAVPYTGSEAHGKFRIPAGTKRDETYGTLTMTQIPSITPFVKTAYEFTNLSTQSRTFQSNGPTGAAGSDPVLSYGAIFYVETTLENFEVNINVMVYDESGTGSYPATSYNSGDLFYLREGDTAWQATGTRSGSGASENYRRKIATTGGFKGYIYQPYGGSASTKTALSACYYNYAGITIWPTTADGSWTDAEGNAAVLKISQPMVALEEITTATPASATVNGGALRDPFTGAVASAGTDIFAADELVGANKDLVELGGNAMSLTVNVDSARDALNNVNAGTGTVTGTFGCYGGNGYSGELVNNTTAFKDSLLHVTGSETATQTAVDMVQLYFTKFTATDHDGYMIYFENKSEDTLYLAFQPYGLKAGGGTNYNQVSAELPFLSQVDGAWQWTTKTRVTTSTYALKSGEKGFFYLDTVALLSSESYYYLKIRTSAKSEYPTTNVDFVMSAPVLVDNYTQESAGMAYVNGADIPQDLMSGEFTVPNDYDGDLAVNLIDLVQAKDEATETDFATFRANYLNTYFNDAEYSVLSATFSVAPLTYLASDTTTILSENPDRGYRTELFVQFASAPLTIAETPDYTLTIGGSNYTVAVEGNTLSDGSTDTDYNINHSDMYPYGVGSGGAVHTVPVAAATAYAAENSLASATDAELISAAITMVDNYMQYDYRSGMTNIDVAELNTPIYKTGSTSTLDHYEAAHVYDDEGKLSEIKLLVAHGRRTIFASDDETEWRKRWTHMFDTIYKIGQNATSSFTDNYGNVTYNNTVTNNLFNAYLLFTEFAYKADDEGNTTLMPDGVMTALDFFFDFCREREVKCNFRPSYNADYTQNAYLSQAEARYVQFRANVESQCADEATMIAHIEQMAPIIAENKDVIHKISSGWIGYGGEMAAGYQYPPVSYKNVMTAILENHCIPNGLYFSSRSSTYYTNIINGVEAVAGYNSGNLDLVEGLEADADWAEKYAKWCGFNNDAFFGEQNYSGWGSSQYYDESNPNYDNDTAIAAYAPVDGELYVNNAHVYNITIDSDGVYHWIGDGTTATDNKIPTPMEAIREMAHHRYTDISQWHGYLDNMNRTTITTVMELWQDHDAEWVFEGEVDSVEDGGYFNAEERAAEITAPITKEILEANGIAYDPAYFANTDSVSGYEFIRDHLGYRIVAQDVSVEYDGRKSDKVSVSVDLKNYGFAAAFNMESTLAILDADGNVVQQIKTGDPSTWYNLAPDYYTVERNSSAQDDVLTHTLSAQFDALTKSGTYYVAVKLENTAGTTARFANDVEVNEQGYNILGSFKFVNTKVEPTAKETLKVMSYNIRCLRGGENADGLKDAMTEEQMNDTIAKFDAMLSRENPDILIVTEDRTYFDTGCFETSGGEKSVWELMFSKHFDYAYHTAGGANWPHIYSNYELKDISRIDVAYTDTSDSRKPTVATVTVDGTDITVIGCHPISGSEYAETNRAEYFEAVVNYCADKDYVIIAGDMNTDSADPEAEYKPFVDAGMTLGNFGEFGEYVTYRFGDTANKIDNIIVKGFEMKNFYVGTEDYSDHLPIYSEIYLPKE